MNTWMLLLLLAAYLVIGFGLGWFCCRWHYKSARDLVTLDELRLNVTRQALELNGFRRELQDVQDGGGTLPRERVEQAYRCNCEFEEQLADGTARLAQAAEDRTDWKRLLERVVEHRGQVHEFNTVLERSLQPEQPDELAGALILAVSELCQSNRSLEAELHEARRTIAAQQTRLEDAERDARLDSLTKLANRRAFEERLDGCQARFDRGQEPYAIALFDLDLFKSLNDQFGHRAGDSALAVFGRILAESVRSYDQAARLGGEEFAALLPAASVREARMVAERCRRRVEQAIVHQNGTPVRFTVSAGIAAVREGDIPAAVLERADAALYAAKTAGRNRVHVSGPPESEDDADDAEIKHSPAALAPV
jgi:diguanylate cyclase (GGDEF)-like protein